MPNQYGNSNSNNHIAATKVKTCILLVGHFRNLKNLLRDKGNSSLLVIKNSAISAIFSKFLQKVTKLGGRLLMGITDPEQLTSSPALHLACLFEVGVQSQHLYAFSLF